uniref:Putative secreted protein n=1 Tax=Anopheles darlingi TaxID=43151 RepID=A0A2M4DD36_ANODA
MSPLRRSLSISFSLSLSLSPASIVHWKLRILVGLSLTQKWAGHTFGSYDRVSHMQFQKKVSRRLSEMSQVKREVKKSLGLIDTLGLIDRQRPWSAIE